MRVGDCGLRRDRDVLRELRGTEMIKEMIFARKDFVNAMAICAGLADEPFLARTHGL
jgi:hypothetical protein